MKRAELLLVSSDPSTIDGLAPRLKGANYEVHLASTGQRALEVVLDLDPDLILLDLDLPDSNALGIARALKAGGRTAHIPIVAVAHDAAGRVAAIGAGATDVVALPIDGSELDARIERQITVARVRTALMQSEAHFRSVMESAVDAIISADADGRIRSWNRAAQRLFGHTAEEAIGEPLEIIIPERFREAHHNGLTRVAAGGEPRFIGRTGELAAVLKDGTEIPVELSLAMWVLDERRYFTGIIRDIRRRKAAERKFRSVTDAALDAIVSADRHGLIRSWNRAAELVFGYSEAEAVGKPIEIIIPEEHHQAHRQGMDRVSSGGESRVIGKTVELTARRADGSILPIELSLSTWSVDGEPWYSGIIRDITERKAAEHRLEVQAAQLAEQHEELKARHEELKRSQAALLASTNQANMLFMVVADALPGTVIADRYRLGKKIAAGGFGVVFEATQIGLDRPVAVKLFKPPGDEDRELLFERFRLEGLTASRVSHHNAVGIIDAGVSEGGLPFLVMELLRGQTLSERMKQGRMELDRALAVVADVAAVLGAAHAAGVVHRDIKPSNVFLHASGPEDEVVKVLDFGIAKLTDGLDNANLTRTGQLIGTPKYMAPERLMGDEESTTSDVFSLGVVLYELVTGVPPFATDSNLYTTLWVHMNVDPDPPRDLDPGLPEALSDLILRTLAKEPEDRPEAAEVQAELRALIGGPGAGA